MATTESVIRLVIQPMRALYGVRFGDDQARQTELTAQYVDALRPFTDQQLAKAWAAVRDSFEPSTIKPWPPVPTLVNAAYEHAELDRGQAAVRDWKRVNEIYREAVDQFMAGDLARQARAEGWHLQLHDYVRKIANAQAQVAADFEKAGMSLHQLRLLPGDEYWQLDRMKAEGRISITIPAAELARLKEYGRAATAARQAARPQRARWQAAG